MSSSDSAGKKSCIEIDRISNLPDSVLCHILSFIYTKESVQTCVISKKWKSLWTDVPSLRFHHNPHDDKEKEIIKKKDADFEKLVTMSLSMNRCQSLDIFHLVWFNNANRLDIFPSWLSSVISRNVRIIDLKLSSSDYMFEVINLPNCIFTAKSLEILRLDGDFLVGTPDLVSLPRLECLSLKGVKYECAESVRKLIGGCPVLKSLYIERTNRYDNVAVFTVSSETLEHLEIIAGGFSSVQENISLKLEINAPSLKYFRLCDCVSTNMSLQSLPLLDELHLFDCNNLDFYQDHLEFDFLDFDNTNLLNDPHKWVLDLFDEKLGDALKILTIGNEEILYILADSMKVFSTLTNLILTSLWDWTGLLPVLDKARNLKVLHLNACCRMFNERCEQELPPACLKSSLQRISMMSWLGPHDDDAGGLEIMMDIVKYFLKHGKILQHLDLTDTFGEGDLDLSLQRKCSTFRRKSRGCEIRIVNESKECC